MSLLSKVVVASVASASLAHAQSQPTIAGKVVDRNTRASLPKVAVELMATTSETVLDTAVTEPDGVFTLVAPHAGAYRVRLTADGRSTHVSDSIVVTDGEYLTREFPIDASRREYAGDEVDKPVVPARGSPAPRYPKDLRDAGVTGCVLASFVVDTLGLADRGTLRVLAYSDRGFVQSLWDALPHMRFVPAEIRGRKVPQRVAQPFTWAIDREVNCSAFKGEKKP
jgi:hypothetical protein